MIEVCEGCRDSLKTPEAPSKNDAGGTLAAEPDAYSDASDGLLGPPAADSQDDASDAACPQLVPQCFVGSGTGIDNSTADASVHSTSRNERGNHGGPRRRVYERREAARGGEIHQRHD